MILPSRNIKKHLKVVTDDNEYLADMEKRQAYLNNIKECMESPFGVILINALENVEASAFENLYKASNNIVRSEAKAEIKIARTIKATLMGYAYEKEAFDNAMKQYIEMEQGEANDD